MQSSVLIRRSGWGLGAQVVLLAGMCLSLGGCQRPLQPGETYHKLVVAWPIFDLERTEGVQDGLTWKKETGDAAFWLSSWSKLRKYDGPTQVYRKERNTFIPFYSANVEESPEFKRTWGSVLLYPYQSYLAKGPAGQAPPRQDEED